MTNYFRRLLIQVGKVLPFVVCAIVGLNYIETTCAIATNDYLLYDGITIPNTRVSFFIGRYFEYNIQMLVVLAIISVAIETCIYNKLACLYLGINLLEKSYLDFELEPMMIYLTCLANILICGFFCYKGVKNLLK